MAGLLISILWILIYVVLVAAIIYGVIFVLGRAGFALPEKVVQLVWLAFGLFVLVLIITFLAGHMPRMGVVGLAHLGGYLP